MTAPDAPHILLLGAGHANLLAVRPLRAALPGARITVIDAAPQATYSGMFPGQIAGHYRPDEMQVDLPRFAARHAVTFVQARISGLDPVQQQARLHDGRALGYDLAVLDLGSHTAMPEIPGFADHAVPIKPLGGFAARLATAGGDGPAVLIGGGVAGAEVALALTRRRRGPVSLIEAGPAIAATLRPRSRAVLTAALTRAGVQVLTGAQVAQVRADRVILRDGTTLASALTLGIAGARAHGWLARDLPVDAAGFVRVMPDLRVDGHATLFAAGDCAAMIHAPRPKAGVFAVRQAPVLVHNLIAACRGTAAMRYDPQRDYLKIISLGERVALAEWRGLTLHGRWLWRVKDRIDRQFMRGLQD